MYDVKDIVVLRLNDDKVIGSFLVRDAMLRKNGESVFVKGFSKGSVLTRKFIGKNIADSIIFVYGSMYKFTFYKMNYDDGVFKLVIPYGKRFGKFLISADGRQ